MWLGKLKTKPAVKKLHKVIRVSFAVRLHRHAKMAGRRALWALAMLLAVGVAASARMASVQPLEAVSTTWRKPDGPYKNTQPLIGIMTQPCVSAAGRGRGESRIRPANMPHASPLGRDCLCSAARLPR
jgi:hypothetical protein